jgi:transcription-repair coupling factor (superfamily II helicase)
VLVPTTILAQQHYGTFAERLRDYPFRVEHVSRFRPAAEQRRRSSASPRARSTSSSAPTACLSRDVRAKDLGLIIVDEEQRFGVKQKELLASSSSRST